MKDKKSPLKYKNNISKFKLFTPIEFIEDSKIPPLAFRVILYLYAKKAIKHFIIRKSVIRKLLGSKGNYEKAMKQLLKLKYIYKKNPTSTQFIYRKINDDFTPIIEKLDPQEAQLLDKNDEKLDPQGVQELDPHRVYIDIKSPPKGGIFNNIKNYDLKDPINESPLSTGPLGAVSGLQTENQNQDSKQGLDGSILATNQVSRFESLDFAPRTPLKTNLRAIQSTILEIQCDCIPDDKIKPLKPLNPIIEKLLNSLKNKEVI